MSSNGWPDGDLGALFGEQPNDDLANLFAAAPEPTDPQGQTPPPAAQPVSFAPRTRSVPDDLAFDALLASPSGDFPARSAETTSPPAPPVPLPPPAPSAPPVAQQPVQPPSQVGPAQPPAPAWQPPSEHPVHVAPAQPAPPMPQQSEPAPVVAPQPPAAPAWQPPSAQEPPKRPDPTDLAAVMAPAMAQNVSARGRVQEDRRLTDADRLWLIVDEVLAVTGTDPLIQAKAAALELTRDPELDAEQKDDLFNALKPAIARAGVKIVDPRDVPFVLQMTYDELTGISVLGDLWRDPDITEIMVDRWDRVVIEQGGKLHRTKVSFRDATHANAVARNLALRISDRAVSRSIPLVTAELPQARVTFAYGVVVKGGLSITIRKFRPLIGLDDLINYGSLTQEMVEFLRDCVEARAGVLVSGGTGSGKTTIINLLSSFIPDTERVITIEDAFELQLTNTHVVSLQTKESSGLDDQVSVTLADLLRNTLRMRPDRVIVGEIREGEGAVVMLAAANTGHDGTMTTIHANTADMALNERFVDLVRQVRANSAEISLKRSVASAFDLVVQVTRGRGGRRFISEIASVDKVGDNGAIVITPIFKAVQREDGTIDFNRAPVDPHSSIGLRLEEKETLSRWTTL